MAHVATIPMSKIPMINNFIPDQKNSNFAIDNNHNSNKNINDLNQQEDHLQNNIANQISLSRSMITNNSNINSSPFNDMKQKFINNDSKTLLPNLNYSSYSSVNKSQQQNQLLLPLPPLLSTNRNNNQLLNSSQFATHLTNRNDNSLIFHSNHSFSTSSTHSSLSSIPNPHSNYPSLSSPSYKSILRSKSENLSDQFLSRNINNYNSSHNSYSLPSLNFVLNKIQETQPISFPLPTKNLQSLSSSPLLSSFHSNNNNNNNTTTNNLSHNNPNRIPNLSYNNDLINQHHLDKTYHISNMLPSITSNSSVNITNNMIVNDNRINNSNLIIKSEILTSSTSSSLAKDKFNDVNSSFNSIKSGYENSNANFKTLPHNHQILLDKSKNNSEINKDKDSNIKNENLDENLNDSLSTDDNNSTIIRKYKCKICNKGFTTSGHLARHHRIHTGVKNHECPFEGCNSRFSRQDNCMQHYKTHLRNKKSKKRSK